MRLSLLFIAAVALGAGSCREGPAAILDGVWQTLPCPQCITTITLAQRGTSVTGTGTWYGEACCSGTLAISGSYIAPHASLTLRYTDGRVALYSGTVLDADHMVGTEAFTGGGADTVTFTKR